MSLHGHLRLGALILTATAAMILVGCSEVTGGEPSPTRSASSQQASPEITPPAEDEVAVDPPSTPVPPKEDGRAEVSVVLTNASGVDGISVVALVEGIAEEGGLCSLAATSGGTEVTVSGPGHGSVTSVSCAEGLSIPRDQLQSGSWTVIVTYESDSYIGMSAAATVEVA